MMAKRFSDTDKWKKPWYRKLKPAHKVFWQYILDNCDHAGVWEVDFELAGDFIGAVFNPDHLIEAFSKQVHIFADGRRWFILDFIDFQYGPLRETNNAHRGVLSSLRKHRIFEVYSGHSQPLPSPSLAPAQPLPSPTPGAQDKDKDKDKEDGGLGEETNPDTLPALVIAYLNKKAGKSFNPKTPGSVKLIRGRMADGAALADFKRVIDIKTADWLNDTRMEPFLRPDTLFRPSNFESYLNQKNAGGSYGQTGSNRGQGRPESATERNARTAREARAAVEEAQQEGGHHPAADHGLLPVDGAALA